MFVYEKKLQYPVRIKNCNPALAKFIITQYGGPYLNRLRFSITKSSIRRDFTPPGCCSFCVFMISHHVLSVNQLLHF